MKLEFTDLIEELLADNPRLSVVQTQMKQVGLKPGKDLVLCMEKTLEALEVKKLKKPAKVENEI